MKCFAWIYIGCCICYGCGNAENSTDDSIAGTYVREHSREILNQLSGNKVGMRTVRDTIYVSSSGDGYRIVNARWRMNDYDNDGWQNMEHGEGGPWPPFEATYDVKSKSLNPRTTAGVPSLSVEENTISVGGKSDIVYSKAD